MLRGKSIRIYMADGTVTGIRHAEIVNWTGQAVACPRNKVSGLSGWEESQLPGVYFLFGFSDTSEKPTGYIGEAENVLTRLQDHLVKKDFWNEIIFFTNKDENLTKSHVKFLESKLISKALSAGRYILENGNQPSLPVLPRADRDSMEDFLDHIILLLGALGHKILEPLTKRTKIHEEIQVEEHETVVNSVELSESEIKIIMKIKNIIALGVQTNEGVVVLKGSFALKRTKDSLSEGYKKLKEELLKGKILIENEENLEFTRDYLFSSPSTAASIISGLPTNGRTSWKTEDGKTIKQLEEKSVQSI